MSGLYVNTNVNSLNAQVNLQNSMGSLTDVLTKLSTGLRINSAKDDPAGLIASEILRSDITGATTAVKNTQRANSMIAVADSALGQISNLLNDVRGLVVEAANTGAMSEDQIAANQLQVDASLDAIDRIANTTEFMGRKLLDGSMAYKTAGLDKSTIEHLQIDKANFGTNDSKAVTINVQQAAQKAMLTMDAGMLGADGARVQIGGNDGTEVFKFNAYSTAQEMADAINEASDRTGVTAIAGQDARSGVINLTSAGADNDIIMWAKEAGFDMGNYSIKYTAGNSDNIEYTITEPTADCAGIIEFKLKMDAVTNASGTLDESSLGIHLSQIGDATNGIVFNSTTGKNVSQVNWVVDNNLTTPVTAILSDDGVLTISYQNQAAATKAELEAAIDKIDGLTATVTGTPAPATNAVQYTADLFVNNGLTVTAKNGGEQYNDMGVVIVTNETAAAATATGTPASAALSGGAITITALNPGEAANGHDFTIDATGSNPPSVSYDATTGAFTISGSAATTNQDVVNALMADNTFKSMFTVTTSDGAAIAQASTAPTAGGVAKAIDFQYQDVPQSSSAVIEDGNGNFIQVKANNTGSDYNGYVVQFIEDSSATGTTAALDEKSKIITISNSDYTTNPNVSYADIKSAIDNLKDSNGNSLFTVNVFTSDPTANSGAAKLTDLSQLADITAGAYDPAGTATGGKTGTKPGEVGTDGATLVVVLNNTAANLATVTAQNVIDAFNNSAATSPELQSMFSITGLPGSGTNGVIFSASEVATGQVGIRQYSSALSGGNNSNVATTAAELVDFINTDAKLSSMFGAEVSSNSGSGLGKLTLFNEVAYYGCPYNGTGLQFLGSDGSPSIELTNLDNNGNKVANQELSLEWVSAKVDNAEAHLAAYNANASFSIEAKTVGGDHDDIAVRFVRSLQADGASSVTYTEGPSNAMAYGSIGGASAYEQSNGAFIFNALDGGDAYNNVTIKASINSHQTEDAVFSYDEASKTFTVSVKNGDVTLADAINSFNNSTNADTVALRSTFSFELDNSYTYTGDDGAGNALTNSENDGSATFASILPSAGSVAVLGNTGTTGGHTGGVLEIVMNDAGGSGANMTANAVVDLINNSEVGKLFTASNYGTSDGTGKIDARKDTIGEAADPANCNSTVNASRMVTSGGVQEEGYFVVHLATDGAGNSTTTAADLVNFFDSLTAEQTKGISVSLINPNGAVNDICNPNSGLGIIDPTTTLGDCDIMNYNDITFGSSCSTTEAKQPLSEIVAVNGADAGFTLYGKKAGTDYEGIRLVYEHAASGDSESVAYDSTNNTITVKIIEGTTTASTVANLINTDSATRDLFEVQLRTVSGNGLATLSDNTVTLSGGTYETEPKGGAKMLWNSDRDDNMLTLVSATEGSSQYINVNVLEGTFNLTDEYGNTATTASGTDTVATINGQSASSNGREISVNTTSLTMSATLSADTESGTTTVFDIIGGGATFQIGPEVNSANQVNVGLQSFRSEDLGGIAGRLYQLREGENADLFTNTALADKIVQQAINQVTTARGRLGALQKTTFDSNIAALQDTIEQLTTARADIVDVDFATASADLTKYQILVQSGSRVLGIANQLPQYAASLLG